MSRKKILLWEMFGILFTIMIGALLHFTFELSGEWKPLAIISGVNESTWEHFKIGFWPAFIWGLIEFFAFRKKVKNFFFAKGISFLVIPAVISILFYGYTFIFNIESLVIDVVIFIIAIAVAQIVSYRLMLLQKRKLYLNIIGGIIIIINIVLFSLLSFFPPECIIFKDPVTGGYGIVEHHH
jgi:hypothetical protein